MSDVEKKPIWEIYKIITTLIRHGMCLPSSQFKVLMFVFDRTYAYNKPDDAIPYRHFLEGVTSKGKLHSLPCGLSEPTLKKALRALVDIGILIRWKGTKWWGTSYEINTYWRHPSLPQMWATDYFDTVTQDQTNAVSPDSSCPPKVKQLENGKINGARARAHARWSRKHGKEETINHLHHAKQQQIGKKELSALSLQRIWRTASITAYPADRCIVWDMKEQVLFMRALRREELVADAPAFIQFCAEQFTQVIRAKLGWMRSPPSHPDVSFVSKHIAVFGEAFAEHKTQTPRLRAEHVRLRTALLSENARLRKAIADRAAAQKGEPIVAGKVRQFKQPPGQNVDARMITRQCPPVPSKLGSRDDE